jgi:queuosine precursor transporter
LDNARTSTAGPRFLWFLILSYTMIIVLSNWFGARLVHIFNVNTGSGAMVFPLTFLLSNLITEVYGYKHARRAIWCGFLFNVLFFVYGQIVIHLPSPDFYVANNKMFDSIFAFNSRIVVASYISYLIAEPANSYIMAKLKVFTHGRWLSVRFVASTVISAGIDSFLFPAIAFYGIFTHHDLINFMLAMWMIKICVEIAGLPVSMWLTKKLKAAERLDIYDNNTNFTLMTLDIHYRTQDNAFER